MFGKTGFGKTGFGKTGFGKTGFGKTGPLKNQAGPLGPNESEFVTAKLRDGTTLFYFRLVMFPCSTPGSPTFRWHRVSFTIFSMRYHISLVTKYV